MSSTLILGIIGSLVLVAGAAVKETGVKVVPIKSTKNWLFIIGNVLIILYSVLNYLGGGEFLFIILEIPIVIANVLMMLDTSDNVSAQIITFSSVTLILYILSTSSSYTTILFVLGLFGVSLGYAFTSGTIRRDAALAIGSIFIGVFSYLTGSWVFLGLNTAFALFSTYYLFTSHGQLLHHK